MALGLTHKGNTKSLFEQLRQTGYQAEQAMLDATNDINTHKGANFSFAVILGAIGWHMQQCFIQRLPLNAKQTEQILKLTGELTHDLIKEDFHDLARKTQRTHGEELFWCMVFQVFVAKLLSVIPVLLPFFFPTYVQQTIMRPMKSFYVPWFY
ncbi:triphosphoribosyl-dephospho-CoA synthase [Enterococcus mundtii]|nr:triphosphoribosyl-dephospho-CoA synthase [Enterococcus mundtii]